MAKILLRVIKAGHLYLNTAALHGSRPIARTIGQGDGLAHMDRTSDTPLVTVVIDEGDTLIALGSDKHLKSLKSYAEGG